MDRYKVKRIKLTDIALRRDRTDCLSDAVTNVITPSNRSPVAEPHSDPVSLDYIMMNQSLHSLKIPSGDVTRDQTERWPMEEGELNLFDPAFGRTRPAVEIEESLRPNRWSLPRLKWCAYCKGEFSTCLNYIPTPKTFLSSLGIFLAGGVCGCFMAPYYIDKCKKPQLLCSKCRRPV